MGQQDGAGNPPVDVVEMGQAQPAPGKADGKPWEPGWNGRLKESLREILNRIDVGSRGLAMELAKLERTYRDAVYSELIYLLSHLRFEPEEARWHWDRISSHGRAMQIKLGSTVDFRVAMLEYFTRVNRQLERPKIIEMDLFEQTLGLAYRDALTGLLNYRSFKEHLNREVSRTGRHCTPLSLIMIDVDEFKSYNDRNGHEAGNRALTDLARLVSECARGEDIVARYGGEEFVLILPSTPKEGAQIVAERVRGRVEDAFLSPEGDRGGRLTVSLGIATCPADAGDGEQLIEFADRALYIAKANGKNQTRLYGRSSRSFRRVDASIEGKFRVAAADCHPLTTLKISEGGLLLRTDRGPAVGSLIDISLTLPDSGRQVAVSARVVRVEEKDGNYETAARITEMPTADRAHLAKYLKALPTAGA